MYFNVSDAVCFLEFFYIWNVWRVALTQSSRLYIWRWFFPSSLHSVAVTFYFLSLICLFVCVILSLFVGLSQKFLLLFDFVWKSGYRFFLLLCVIGVRLKNPNKMCVCTRYTSISTTQLFPLFFVCVQLHWFASLPAPLVLIIRGFILSTKHSTEIIFFFFTSSFACLLILLLVCCLLCHTFFEKVDDTVSLAGANHKIQAVYQISFRRHLSRMQCLTVYKSTRFACEIKKSYLILCEIKFQIAWLREHPSWTIYIFFPLLFKCIICYNVNVISLVHISQII